MLSLSWNALVDHCCFVKTSNLLPHTPLWDSFTGARIRKSIITKWMTSWRRLLPGQREATLDGGAQVNGRQGGARGRTPSSGCAGEQGTRVALDNGGELLALSCQ
jgi:hypothetical protein